jgi:dihydroflavonol-4-reductase
LQHVNQSARRARQWAIYVWSGANGHLGNNLVRALLEQGHQVRAGVRDLSNTEPFQGLECELIYAELEDKAAMLNALQGVEGLYQVAAVFKHWSLDREAEIVRANIEGMRIVLEAAAQAGVKRVVYVSSVAAVGHNGQPLHEDDWNQDLSNPYYRSKILSEQKAWQVAQAHDLQVVAVLPSAMVGPNAQRLTDTMAFIDSIRKKAMPLDPNFHFNFGDVRDMANACTMAAQQGIAGQRYILANQHSSPFSAIVTAANCVTPGYKQPPVAPKWLLLAVAWGTEWLARLTGKPANLTMSQVQTFYGVKQEYAIAKAREQLAFRPRSPAQALQKTFAYLHNRLPG